MNTIILSYLRCYFYILSIHSHFLYFIFYILYLRFVFLYLDPDLDTDTVFVFSRDNAWLFTAYVTGTGTDTGTDDVFILIGLISIFSIE